MGKYVSNRRWYRAVKRGMREADKQRRRNKSYYYADNDFWRDVPFGRWFEKKGCLGYLLFGAILLTLVLILYYTGTIFVFLMICGLVWFVRALFS